MKARSTSQPPASQPSASRDTAKVTPLYPAAEDVPPAAAGSAKTATPNPRDQARRESASYIAQMTLELERLAATADLELVAYFLAMARAEAEASLQTGPARD